MKYRIFKLEYPYRVFNLKVNLYRLCNDKRVKN